jgi:hypothetical protein
VVANAAIPPFHTICTGEKDVLHTSFPAHLHADVELVDMWVVGCMLAVEESFDLTAEDLVEKYYTPAGLEKMWKG